MKSKRTRILLGALVVTGALTAGAAIAAVGFASPDASATTAASEPNYIGEDQAKTIALDDAGVSEAEALHLSIWLDADDRIDDYDIEFIAGGTEYDYEINAVTGDIMDRSQERLYTPEGAAPVKDSADTSGEYQDVGSGQGSSDSSSAASGQSAPATNQGYWDDDPDDWDDRYDDRDDWDDRYDDRDDRDDWDDDRDDRDDRDDDRDDRDDWDDDRDDDDDD